MISERASLLSSRIGQLQRPVSISEVSAGIIAQSGCDMASVFGYSVPIGQEYMLVTPRFVIDTCEIHFGGEF